MRIERRRYPKGQLVRCAVTDHIYHINDCIKNWKGQWVGKENYDPKPLYLTPPKLGKNNLHYTNGALSYKK